MSDKDESVSAFVVTDDGLPLASGYTDMTVVSRRRYTQLVKAKHSGRWWMLKGLLPACRDQMIYQNLLQKEYKLMAPLQHPNVVNTLNWEQIDGLGCCIVMEWIDGVNLQQWLAGRHPQKDRRRVASQMMDTWEKILPAIQGFVHEKTVLNDEARLQLETTLQKYAYDKYQRPWLSILNEAREKAGQ